MKETSVFWSPRYTGKRFEGHTIPLDVIKDLPAIEDLLKEIMRYQLKQQGRRMPPNFTKNVCLGIQDIEAGSARPLIVCAMMVGMLFDPYTELLNNAKAAFIDAVNQANNAEQVTAIPQTLCSFFDKIGRSLHEDEAIEFAPDASTESKAAYTQKTRQRLLNASTQPDVISQEVSLKCQIVGVQTVVKTFEINHLLGGRYTSSYEVEVEDSLVEYLWRDSQKKYVQIEGTATYAAGKFVKFSEIKHITQLEDMDVSIRLHEFLDLQTGWLNGKGIAPKKELLSAIDQLFDRYYPPDLPLPWIYPTPEGGVLAEWSLGGQEISLEIEPKKENAFLHMLQMDTDEEATMDISLNEVGWGSLVSQLRGASNGNA